MAERTSPGSSRVWRRWAIALTVVGIAGSGVLAPVTAGAVDPSADLSVAISHTPDSATAPADVTFTLTAANAGPDTAVGVAAGIGFAYPLELKALPDGCRRSASYESIVCDLGDVASGASASVDIVISARGSGVFTIPAVAASETPDPDTADRVVNDSLLIKAGPSQAVRYIRGIFPSIMNRNPDTATTNYWAAKWKAVNDRYPRRPEEVPAGIMKSNEYRRIRIRESYERILGRAPDAPSLTSWVNKAAAGMAYETIDRRLLTSNEFTRKPDSVEALIVATYQAVLGRAPSAAEAKAAFDSQARQSYAAFVLSLQRSSEGYDRIIDQRYQSALGHGPSALGRYGWQVELRRGVSPEALWARLFVSSEVLAKYPYTFDDYENGFDGAVPVSSVEAALAGS